MDSLPPLDFGRDEFASKYMGSLTFLNGRIYKGNLIPIDGKFNGILEIEDGSFYPVRFHFFEGSCIEFEEIIDPKLVTTLLYGYNSKFGINSNIRPFNKEEISKIFNFDLYKKEITVGACIHVTIQHWIGNYDGNNIGYMPEGKGKLLYKNGDVYEGEFYRGAPEGKGKLTFNKCGKMEGKFKEGTLTGEGVLLYPNRGEYKGEFRRGLPYGKGKVIYNNGDIYEGDFYAGVANGKGKLMTKNGKVIKGDFEGGKFIDS